MRILLAIPSLRCGGSERVMSILASHWAEHGHDVSLASFEPPENDFFSLDERVRRFVIGGTGTHGIGWLRANRHRVDRLRHAVTQSRADVVLSFLYTMNLLAVGAVRGRAPVIVCERTDPRHKPIEPWQGVLRRLLYPRASAVVVQTDQVLQGWARGVARGTRSYAIPNPVLPAQTAVWRDVPTSGPVLAAVGRLEASKGFDVLIRAFARVAKKHGDWSLVILGEGEERGALVAKVRETELAERVFLPGAGDTAALLSRADLFATASRVEGFPNALLEAMAAGLPVVATDSNSGPREIIRDGVDGCLVAVDDVERLAEALGRLMGSAELRSRYGARAVEVVDRFGLDRIAARWEAVFADVRHGRRG